MKTNHLKAKSLLLTLMLGISAYAGEQGVLIASQDVEISTLSKASLESILMGKTSIWENGTRISIGFCNTNPQKVESFLQEYTGQNERRYKKYWVKKVFAGYGVAPKLFKTDDKALEYARRLPGVIAFVTVDDLKELEGVKIITVDGKANF